MTQPETWEEQRNWLKSRFMGDVVTTWNGPESFTSEVLGLSLLTGSNKEPITSTGITGEDSVRNLFDHVTNHASGTYLIMHLAQEFRLVVNRETLEVETDPKVELCVSAADEHGQRRILGIAPAVS